MLVSFADRTSTSANLVIGADGIHSAVRSHYVVRDTRHVAPVLSTDSLPE